MKTKSLLVVVSVAVALAGVLIAAAQGPQPSGELHATALTGTGFTYQGQLKSGGASVNGTCGIAFRLFDASSGGNLIGTAMTPTVPVTNGLFTTLLDFGTGAFNGDARWLDMQVSCPASSGTFTPLSRQQLTAAPYALYSAGNWGLNGNTGALGGNFLGTKNYTSLTIGVNGIPALRIDPGPNSPFSPPNLIGGSSGNSIDPSAYGATIGGGGGLGADNHVTLNGRHATIGGGEDNSAGGFDDATVGGGAHNTASWNYATVGGGGNNTASDTYDFVGGGGYNTAKGRRSTVSGGYSNTVSGFQATVPGGATNTASGDNSFAAGTSANTNGMAGAFVWGDSSVTTEISATTPNQFLVRAAGGAGIGTDAPAAQLHVSSGGTYTMPQLRISQTTAGDFARLRLTVDNVSPTDGFNKRWDIGANPSSFILYGGNYGDVFKLQPGDATNYLLMANGARLTAGGAWTNSSDRSAKRDFSAVDQRALLDKVAGLPMQSWAYKTEDASVRHLGPMAQDFYTAFGLGADDTHISTVDESGVALAAIQGLYSVVQVQDARIAQLEATQTVQQLQIADLHTRLIALESMPDARSSAALQARITVLEQARSGDNNIPTTWLLFGGTIVLAAVALRKRL